MTALVVIDVIDTSATRAALGLLLDVLGARRVVLMGAATEMCVRDTAIDATRQGYETAVVSEACLCQDPELERRALEALTRLIGVRVADAIEELDAEARG